MFFYQDMNRFVTVISSLVEIIELLSQIDLDLIISVIWCCYQDVC